MLYDPKRHAHVKPSLDDFKAWLGKQPAHKTYEYADCHICAIGQYLVSIGTSYPAEFPKWQSVFNLWNGSIASPQPRTFGAAYERARAYEE